jgi:tetratricopeptide (TPR) repeat protein
MKLWVFSSFLIGNLIIINAKVNAQPADQLAFDEITSLYEEEHYNAALLRLKYFMEEFPDSPLRGRAHFNLATIQEEVGDTVRAIQSYQNILNSNYNELDEAGGLMEQYTLYKHQSASRLAELFLQQKDYQEAIYYTQLADKKYPYQHFCGNELTASEIYIAYSYARAYQGLNKLDRAIKYLIPHTFYTGLAENDHINELLIKLLFLRYSTQEIENLIAEAKESLTIKNGRANIKFLGKKITYGEEALFYNLNDVNPAFFDRSEEELLQAVLDKHPVFGVEL